MTMPAVAAYDVRVDWVGDTTFDDGTDDVSDDVLGNPGLAITFGRDHARSLAPPMIGVADFTLLNEDQTYSAEYAASPVYQLMRPGKSVLVRAQHGTRSTYRSHRLYRAPSPYRGVGIYPLFRGSLDTIEQRLDWGNRAVALGCLGTAAALLRQSVTVPIYASITTGAAIGRVLDAVGWQGVRRSLAVGDTTLRWWWADERPAWDVLLEILASEGAGALLYEDADGILRFENRNFRASNARSMTAQATFLDESSGTRLSYRKHLPYRTHATYRSTDSLFYVALRYDPHWEDVIERVLMPITQRVVDASLSVVWSLGTTISLNVIGQPVVITAQPQDPFLGAVAPVAGTDYTVSGGTATVALTSATGRVATLTLTDTSGSPTINDLQLRAQALRSVGDTLIEASTQNPPFDGTLQLKTWPEIDPNQAQSVANSVLVRYGGRPLPRVEIDVLNADGHHMSALLDLRISDRITIYNDHLGLASDFYVESIKHTVTTGGRHLVTLGCEQVTALGSSGGSLWDGPTTLWDSAVWGI